MNVNIRNRFIAFGVIAVSMFVLLFVQLIQLTLVKGEEYAAALSELDQRTISVSGARGSILDRNGLPLAYDEKSYDVQFYRDPTKNSETDRAYYTGIIIDTIKIVEENGGKTVDTFAIQYNEETGEYDFDWGITDAEAMQRREANWRENMYVGTKRTPEQIYLYLRSKYKIPSEMGFAEARKILSIWQDVQLASWVAYEPIDVAYTVSIQTVSEIETHSIELEGMSIAESTVRIYPRTTVLAHTIGYLGNINDPDVLKEYQALGYSVDDLVGVEGIEETMEEYLTGNSAERQGTQQVEIDNMAIVKNVLSSTQPTQGDNVMLTIDIPLQLAVEASLEKNIAEIREKQIARYYDRIDIPQRKDGYEGLELDDIALAESGAAVVLDVNTGEVLALASYPSFDLNIFTGGISDEDFNLLNDDEAAPLYNKAVLSRGTPGSIFKMVTGLAALMEGEQNSEKGTTLYEEIDCQGKFDVDVLYGEAPGCWTSHPEKHQDQTIVEGLEHSCNYYFFTLARRLGIDLLDKWGGKFGLTASTGIELPGEAIGQVGNQQVLYDPDEDIDNQNTWIPYQVKFGEPYGIVYLLESFAEENELKYQDGVIDDTADELIRLMGINWEKNSDGFLADERGKTLGEHTRDILARNMQISTKISYNSGLSENITNMLSQLIWSPIHTIQTGIGQGYVQLTPIAVARYVAALVNGGTVYETHVVDKVIAQDGTVLYNKEPVVYDTLGARQEYLNAIKDGMSEVVSGEDGTAAEHFKNFPDEYLNMIGGKTGTAEVSDIDLENNSWFVSFAPFDDPEIAVVVYVPHGFSGGWSTYVAQDILQFYFDGKQEVAEQTIPDVNALVVPGYEPPVTTEVPEE